MSKNKWCERCDESHASHKVTYRTDRHLPKWSSPNGEMYISEVCVFCFQELEEEVRNGSAWNLEEVQ